MRFILALVAVSLADAAVLRVGPNEQYETPCRAIGAAAEGDTIQIDASGTYQGDVCGWKTNGLTIVGVHGRPKIDAAGRSEQGKAIWVISGDNTTLENIEMTGAVVRNNNGAAIRQEGANLTMRHCFLHGNQEGILAGDNAKSEILVETTEFSENGYSDGQSHNLYINHIAKFTLQYCYSHDSISGHLVKSRAARNFILYNRLTGEMGTSSYELDLPNGGRSYVIGNVIEQGFRTENSTMIAFAEEGATNVNNELYFVNNTVVNDHKTGAFLRIGSGVPPVLVENNVFVGTGLKIDQATARSSHNLQCCAIFVDAGSYDYHLKGDSPGRDLGADPGSANGISLTPVYQYVHPTCFETRKTTGKALDAGAFEFHGGGGVSSSCAGQH